MTLKVARETRGTQVHGNALQVQVPDVVFPVGRCSTLATHARPPVGFSFSLSLFLSLALSLSFSLSASIATKHARARTNLALHRARRLLRSTYVFHPDAVRNPKLPDALAWYRIIQIRIERGFRFLR